MEQRCTEANLKQYIDSAVRTASALLAENYLAQDRKRLIRCLELLDEATRAVEGGMWVGQERVDTAIPVVRVDSQAPVVARSGGLIAASNKGQAGGAR